MCTINGMTDDETKHAITELYSPPRVNAPLGETKRRDWIRAGSSFDLIVDASTGESWDLLEAEDRRKCLRRLGQEGPWVVIGLPPCTAMCNSTSISGAAKLLATRPPSEGPLWATGPSSAAALWAT